MGTPHSFGGIDVFGLQPSLPEAACKDHPGLPWVPDLFSGPARARQTDAADVDRMRRICASCVHLIECRDYALSDSSIYGVWGGLTSHERREVRAGRRRIARNGRGVTADL